jgi:hypothetical protein
MTMMEVMTHDGGAGTPAAAPETAPARTAGGRTSGLREAQVGTGGGRGDAQGEVGEERGDR